MFSAKTSLTGRSFISLISLMVFIAFSLIPGTTASPAAKKKATPWVPLLLLGADIKVSISADPERGPLPLTVMFSVSEVKEGTPPYSYAWDLDGDGSIDDTSANPMFIYTSLGSFQATLTLTDKSGSEGKATTQVTVLGAPSVIASASPTMGQAPLGVSFSCTASDPDGTIQLYEWDFDGDGTYDWSSSTDGNASHTYSTKGAYQATVRVTDNDQIMVTDTVTILVGTSPTATVSTEGDTTAGVAPFEVEFEVDGTDPDGSIVLYEWDFDGDGIYDWSSTTSGDVTHTYTAPGVYVATLRITDNDGLITIIKVVITVSGPPTSLPRAFPTSGKAPLTVTFFCDGEDPDGSVVKFAWDFDGDGTYEPWDYNSDGRIDSGEDSIGHAVSFPYTYDKGGTYKATLKVTDNDGLSSTAFVTITVEDDNPEGYPTATASALPTNGGAPLRVLFQGQGTDRDGFITSHAWDFEGDGTYDEQFLPSKFVGVKMDPGYNSAPVFSDIDGDGDHDLFIGNSDGKLVSYRNIGTSNAPSWVSEGEITDSEGTSIDVGYRSIPALVDIDNDGDYDLFVGNSDGKIILYRNIGTSSVPSWTSEGEITDSSNTVIDVGGYAAPALVDIDNDGDYDLFSGEYYGRLFFYRNDGSSSSPSWKYVETVTESGGGIIDLGYYSAFFFVDIDKDGDYDLFGGESNGRLFFYRNDGNSSSPSWTAQGEVADSRGTNIDIGYNSIPAFVDIEGDGDYDLFAGEYYGRIYFFRNIGNTSSPSWLSANPDYSYVGVDYYSVPAFVDIDGDGDNDLLVGGDKGTLHFYRNDGDSSWPDWTYLGESADSAGTAIDVGYRSAPTFVDIDKDGDYDLFIGNSIGTIVFYRNGGSSLTPNWISEGEITDSSATVIDTGYDSKPALVDIDDDGDYDLFLGESYGRIHFYRNDGSANSPSWTSVGTIADSSGTTIDIGSRSSPAFVDVDGDGDYDLFSGEYYGKLYFYRNSGSKNAPIWTSEETMYPVEGYSYTAPTFADLDNDQDYDLFVGEYYGQILHYPTVSHTYSTPGTYQATFRVTDNIGLSGTDSVAIEVLSSGFPTAAASAAPTSGSVPLKVSFSGKGRDPDGSIKLFDWDFDGDGTYDWSNTTTGDTSHTYNIPGTYEATLRVTDNTGNTAADSVTITASVGISSTSTEIFNPITGGKGTITTTLTAGAEVTILIVDQAGNVVRRLVVSAQRAAGTYEDVWDGKDEAGNVVEPGIYYFVIDYVVNGETFTYDPRETFEYEKIVPSRSFTTVFSPYEDNFIELTYTLYDPAEVEIFFWTRGPTGLVERVRTLLVREPVGSGTHTVLWDGTDDEGNVLPPETEYPPVIWAWNIPDNGMIVLGEKLAIADIAAEPNYFSPAYNPYGALATQQTVVSFNLLKKANLEVKIVNAEGALVKAMNIPNLPRGPNSITWDGKDMSGKLVKAGSYRITLTAVDKAGNRSNHRSVFLIVSY